MPSATSDPDRGRRRGRRVVQRGALVAAFGLGIAGFLVLLLPFTASGADGALRCGPAVYEVLVPADPDLPAPEDVGCAGPARGRMVVGAALIAGGVAVAVTAEVRGRRRTAEAHQRWLERGSAAARKRPAARAP